VQLVDDLLVRRLADLQVDVLVLQFLHPLGEVLGLLVACFRFTACSFCRDMSGCVSLIVST
jgi:hypothetical protein